MMNKAHCSPENIRYSHWIRQGYKFYSNMSSCYDVPVAKLLDAAGIDYKYGMDCFAQSGKQFSGDTAIFVKAKDYSRTHDVLARYFKSVMWG